MNTESEMRPLDYTGILDKTVELYKANAKVFIGIAAVVYVPLMILHALLLRFFLPRVVVLESGTVLVTGGGNTGLIYLFATLEAAAPFIVGAALVFAVSRQLLGRPATIGDSYHSVLSIPAVPVTALLCGALIMAGNLVVLAGIVVAFLCSFVAETMTLERKTLFDAITRSGRLLVEHNEWIRALVLGIFFLVLFMGVNWVLSPLARMGDLSVNLGFASHALIMSIALPAIMVATIVLYFDIRVRYEGYSLQALATELGGTPVAPVAPPPQPPQDIVPPQPPAMAHFCVQCGKPVDTHFCMQCGAPQPQ